MREITRNRMNAVAKSRRATPAELREAKERIKEIEAELKQIELQPETRQGEERERRYERVVRLRAMRDDFQSQFPTQQSSRVNSLLLALVMTVSSFLICAFCAGGTYAAYSALNQKPDPTATAQGFWDDIEQQQYNQVHSNFLAPTLRVALDPATFGQVAQQADADYGIVTSAILVKKEGDLTQSAQLTYSVTRAKNHVTYTVVLVLQVHLGAWGITDLGAAIEPTLAGLPPVSTPTSTNPSDNSTATPGASGRRQTPAITA